MVQITKYIFAAFFSYPGVNAGLTLWSPDDSWRTPPHASS